LDGFENEYTLDEICKRCGTNPFGGTSYRCVSAESEETADVYVEITPCDICVIPELRRIEENNGFFNLRDNDGW
jgi:hypothetical protein